MKKISALKKAGVVVIALAVVMTLGVTGARAVIVGGAVTGGTALDKGATFYNVPDPSGLAGDDNFDINTLFAFYESTTTLTEPMSVDIGVPGVIAEDWMIPAGTTINSYYIAYDPTGLETLTGYVEFEEDEKIIGIATTRETLYATKDLGHPDVFYYHPRYVGLEPPNVVGVDMSNPNTIYLDWRAFSPGDYIRVFTISTSSSATVPEPATMALLGLGLPGIIAARRRKKKK